MVDAARRADRLLGVDLVLPPRSRPFAVARDLRRSGELGEIVAADLVFHNAYGPDKPWFFDPDARGRRLRDRSRRAPRRPRASGSLDLDPVRRSAAGCVGDRWSSSRRAELDHVRLACSWNLHAGRDAVIEATFHGSAAALCPSATSTARSTTSAASACAAPPPSSLVAPPDDWAGRAAVVWARRVAAGERFDRRRRRSTSRRRVLDRIYGR